MRSGPSRGGRGRPALKVKSCLTARSSLMHSRQYRQRRGLPQRLSQQPSQDGGMPAILTPSSRRIFRLASMVSLGRARIYRHTHTDEFTCVRSRLKNNAGSAGLCKFHLWQVEGKMKSETCHHPAYPPKKRRGEHSRRRQSQPVITLRLSAKMVLHEDENQTER